MMIDNRLIKTIHLLVLLITINISYADNTELFNQAMSIGNQNQFNLNLNQNSSINSYGQQNKFDSSVANNANAGNANAKNMYNGQQNDPNYLYNNGRQSILDCETKTDPRCTTINKYGDKDTQSQIQAYTQGISTRYLMSVAPDPIDKSCSIVKRKNPINQTTASCISSAKQQNQCNNTITPYSEKLPPIPVDGVVLHNVGSPGVCGVGQSSGSWIPQGDRAWFIITSSEGSFDGGTLPITMGATSGVTPCRGASNSIIVTPTTVRRTLGQFYMDWFGSQRGDIAFYQEPGQNCGIDSTTPTCTIGLTLSWAGGGVFTSWSITFDRPQTHRYAKHYKYTKGCANAN